jgi:hypothetical protein
MLPPNDEYITKLYQRYISHTINWHELCDNVQQYINVIDEHENTCKKYDIKRIKFLQECSYIMPFDDWLDEIYPDEGVTNEL